jgi:hypothetical protein
MFTEEKHNDKSTQSDNCVTFSKSKRHSGLVSCKTTPTEITLPNHRSATLTYPMNKPFMAHLSSIKTAEQLGICSSRVTFNQTLFIKAFRITKEKK